MKILSHLIIGQYLATKLIVTLNYKIHYWITFSSYIFHACKISRKLKINSYIIHKFFLIPSFCGLKLCIIYALYFLKKKLCIIYKLIDYIISNIWLIQNLACVLRACSTCNSTVRFSKYVVMFILLSKVVVLSYN